MSSKKGSSNFCHSVHTLVPVVFIFWLRSSPDLVMLWANNIGAGGQAWMRKLARTLMFAYTIKTAFSWPGIDNTHRSPGGETHVQFETDLANLTRYFTPRKLVTILVSDREGTQCWNNVESTSNWPHADSTLFWLWWPAGLAFNVLFSSQCYYYCHSLY